MAKQLKNGRGTYTFADGAIFQGSFAGDCREGIGKTTFKDGSYYHGELKRLLRGRQALRGRLVRLRQ